MNNLTPSILTTTRPLSEDDRLDLWKQKRDAQGDQTSSLRRHPVAGPLSALRRVRAFFRKFRN